MRENGQGKEVLLSKSKKKSLDRKTKVHSNPAKREEGPDHVTCQAGVKSPTVAVVKKRSNSLWFCLKRVM